MKLKFNHAGVWVIGEFKVLPGLNDLPGFEKHLGHPDVKEKMATKNKEGHPILEVMEKAAKGEIPAETKTGLAGLKEKDAISMVKECLNERDLNAWKEDEKRPKVLKAIEEQIKTFSALHAEKKEE